MRRSLRLRYDVQSPWATGVAVEMRFIPSEFRSLAFFFSPLPLSYPFFRSTYRQGCASEQCIHVYSLVMCIRICIHLSYICTLICPPPLPFLSLFLHTFVPLLPQEQRIMLFRFTYMRPTVPDSRYRRCGIPAISCDILASLHEFFLPAHVYSIR